MNQDQDQKPLSAYCYKTKGRYDLCSTEQEWQIVVRASNGTTISEIFPGDEEPEIDGLPPSDVVEVIAARLGSYLFKSGRDAEIVKIEWFRQNSEQIDSGWARKQIEDLRSRIDELSRYVLTEEVPA